MENIIYVGPEANGVIHIIDRVLDIPIDQITTATKAGLSGVVNILISVPDDPKLTGIVGPVPDWTL